MASSAWTNAGTDAANLRRGESLEAPTPSPTDRFSVTAISGGFLIEQRDPTDILAKYTRTEAYAATRDAGFIRVRYLNHVVRQFPEGWPA